MLMGLSTYVRACTYGGGESQIVMVNVYRCSLVYPPRLARVYAATRSCIRRDSLVYMPRLARVYAATRSCIRRDSLVYTPRLARVYAATRSCVRGEQQE